MYSISRRAFVSSLSAAAGAAAWPAAGRSSTVGNTVAAAPALQSVRKFIQDKVTKGIVPSVVVQVTRDGKPIWAEAFGFADLENRRPATLDSIYKIASISKPFTVSALMTLVDRGIVDLDRPANAYLKSSKLRAYRGFPDQMTLRRLANHTSGLPIHEILFFDGAPRLTPAETIARYGFAASVPGTRFVYSNLGTATLGFVSADVTRTSWPAFMREAILDPLGLSSTFPELMPGREAAMAGAKARHLTRQYDYDISGRFVRTGAHLTSHPGASSMWSNAADLTRFAEMHLNGGAYRGRQILSPTAVATMQQFVVATDDPGVVHGSGWIQHANLVRRNFNHSGGGPGMGVALAAYPDDGVVSVVLTNYSGAMAVETNRQIAEALFGPAAAPPTSTAAKASAPPEPLIGKWCGFLRHHDGDIAVELNIVSGDSAEMRFGRIPPAQLAQVTARGGEFSGTAVGILMRGPGYHGDSIIDFALRLEDGLLVGIADTYAKGYFEVAHWVEMKRIS